MRQPGGPPRGAVAAAHQSNWSGIFHFGVPQWTVEDKTLAGVVNLGSVLGSTSSFTDHAALAGSAKTATATITADASIAEGECIPVSEGRKQRPEHK